MFNGNVKVPAYVERAQAVVEERVERVVRDVEEVVVRIDVRVNVVAISARSRYRGIVKAVVVRADSRSSRKPHASRVGVGRRVDRDVLEAVCARPHFIWKGGGRVGGG